MRLRYILACTLYALSLAAAPVPELPAESFFKYHEHDIAQLSPDGKFLATLSPHKGQIGLAVISLDSNKANWAFAAPNADVAWFRWVNSDRLIFHYSKDGNPWPGLNAVNRDGTKANELTHWSDLRTGFLATIPGSTNEVLVNSYVHPYHRFGTAFLYPNVERLNLWNGAMTREVTNPGQVVNWLTDHGGVVRIGIELDETRYKVLHRTGPGAPWQTIADFNFDDDGINPIAFDYDDRTLFVKHRGGEPTDGIYPFDVVSKQLKPLAFRHANADVEHIMLSEPKRAMVGADFEFERPETFWFDSELKKLQSSVDASLPQTVNRLVSASESGSRKLFLSASDRTPGTYYLWDEATSKLSKQFDVASWIDPELMAEMKPIEYLARDGLKIHGYLTIPKASSGRNLPMVVNPHGGPQARDSWGFDPDVQFLANRGYAVLQMNFRGSTGYGYEFMKAGFKQWGLKQQDDITDGAKWAIAEGIADPARIAIYGASYGGFAALAGLVSTPELYRCGICYAGVVDIRRAINKRVSEEREFGQEVLLLKATFAEHVGDSKKDNEQLNAVSPLLHVDKIQVPVFMAHGELDPRAPISIARDMAHELKKRGKLYDFMVKDKEGHGFRKEENQIEFWKKVDAFLKENLK
jgi:dipeptidyl aminopeptidase/acylaminoacyl peptidase